MSEITEEEITNLYECLSASDHFDIRLDDVFAKLTDHYRASQWRSVETELPNKPMPCIAYMKDRDSVIVTYWDKDFFLARCGTEKGFEGHGVTHWVPLPEPPTNKGR